MKGVVFTVFNDMVEQEVGIEIWDRILDSVNPDSRGIYTAVEDFPDEELVALITELSGSTGKPVLELLYDFGQYLFHALAMKHSVFIERETDFLEFLKSIEDVIHKEVEKLYPNPILPSLKWEQADSNSLTLYYQSDRKMCHLAEGLIKGAAERFKVDYSLNHDVCMHSGGEHCKLDIHLL